MRMIRSAVAVACCVMFSQSARALDRTEFASAVKIYFAGPATMDRMLEQVFLSNWWGICDSTLGDIDVWRTSNQVVITCRVSNENSPNHGFASRAHNGTMIAFHKESEVAIISDISQLIRVAKGEGHGLRWLDLSQLTDDCTVTTIGITSSRQPYTDHSNCPNSRLTFVDTAASSTYDVHGSISATEPKLAYPAPGVDAARVVSSSGHVTMYGVPVTTALYRALQVAQFGDGNPCDGSDLPTCVPSLTRAQVAALYSQYTFDWNNFKSVSGINLPAVPGVTPPSDPYVRICRGVASSDAQALFEAYFLREHCVSGSPSFAYPDDQSSVEDWSYHPPNFPSGSLVNASPSEVTIRSCLRTANQQNYWGLGVLSTEIVAAEWTPTSGFRFVAIDGAAPTLVNLANGDYDFFAETSINRISPYYSGNEGGLADGNPRREVIEALGEHIRYTTTLSHYNDYLGNRPWGRAGLLAPSSTPAGSNFTAPYSEAEISLTPIATQTREGNTCGPAIMSKPQPVNGTPNP